MAKIIVNTTNKGGEGKTTNSIMFAEYLTLVLKRKTLIIDLDPQANISARYLKMEYDPTYKGGKLPPLHEDYEPENDIHWDGRSSIADIFYGQEVIPYETIISDLEILPSYSAKLQEAEAVTKSEVLEKVHLQLHRFLHMPEVQEAYDAIVIDTPPSKGPLTTAAIKAATHVIIPAQMEQFSIEGIYGMLQLWKQESYARSADNPINLVGILPNKYRDINIHKSFLASLKNADGLAELVMPNLVKERAIYKEILVENANPSSVFQLPKSHPARLEYESVCEFIARRVFNHVEKESVSNQ